MFKKGDLVKVQYPVAFENGEQLAKAAGIVVLVEKELDKILDTQVVEVQWSDGIGQVRYYSESLMLVARS